jgi:hypothetical protein
LTVCAAADDVSPLFAAPPDSDAHGSRKRRRRDFSPAVGPKPIETCDGSEMIREGAARTVR